MYELLFHPEAESEIYDLEPIMQAKGDDANLLI